MLNTLGPNTTPGNILGYCTNVHAGVSLDEVRANLFAHALPVKRAVSPDAPMGVGLWFACDAAVELIEKPEKIGTFKNWLDDHGLLAYTLNGFPYGNFHDARVKTKVYEPTWAARERYDYTLALATILSELLPDDATEGSISTLPLGWPPAEVNHRKCLDQPAEFDETFAKACAVNLTDLTHYLARIELDTGKCIHIDLEPEPGCCLDTAPGMVDYFERYLLGTPDDETTLGYLRVCHDVCHSAVMFEPQKEAFDAYRHAGIKVGKVQLSSAIRVNFDKLPSEDRTAAMTQLESFCEDRYQHQASIRYADGTTAFYADLPDAIAVNRANGTSGGEWRVHFHVPVYLDSFGAIETTQNDVIACLDAIELGDEIHHFEVETYAWEVLPETLKCERLADGIAEELRWVCGVRQV